MIIFLFHFFETIYLAILRSFHFCGGFRRPKLAYCLQDSSEPLLLTSISSSAAAAAAAAAAVLVLAPPPFSISIGTSTSSMLLPVDPDGLVHISGDNGEC